MSLFKSKTVTLYRAEPLGSPVVKKTKWNINVTSKTTIPKFTAYKKNTRAKGTFFGGKPRQYFFGLAQIKKVKLPVKILQKKFPHKTLSTITTTGKSLDYLGKKVDYSSAKDVKRIYEINLSHKHIKKAKLDLPRTIYHNISKSQYGNSSVYHRTKELIKHPVIKKAFKKVAKKVAVRTALAVSGVGTAAAVALTAHDIYSGSKWLYKKYKK